MSRRPAIRRLAILLSLFTLAALIVALPITPLVGSRMAAAHASVAVDDVVFLDTSGGYNRIAIRDSGGDITDLTPTTLVTGTPDVSPDGSRIAFWAQGTCVDHDSYQSVGLQVMNSDGSGRAWLTLPHCHSGGAGTIQDTFPRWSPDGTWVAYVHQDDSGYGSYSNRIYKVRADATGVTPLTTTNYEYDPPSWSPDGSKIVYDTWYGYSHPQLFIMDADGTDSHLIRSSDSGYGESYPTWAPDGNRVYFVSTGGTFGNFYYYSSEDGFSTTSVTRNPASGATLPVASEYDLSADGSTIVYRGPADATLYHCNELWTLDISGETSDQVTSDTCSGTEDPSYYTPRYVKADWPPAPPSNSTVALSSPSPSDAPYTRQITIGLSASGVEKFQYGWSTSSSTAPNTSYLQESTDLTTPYKGTLDYRGKYSGSGTTWNGGTQPDEDWYLWVRSVQTGGTPNSWGTPLKIHTPKKPIWVVVGDSYSSGHHENLDEPQCPTSEDAASTGPFYSLLTDCSGSGHDLAKNDDAHSWANWAYSSFNSSTHAPTAWQVTLGPDDADGLPVYFLARSGEGTRQFGNESAGEPGSAAWASTGQAGKMGVALYERYNSWNVVSMTGGADDTNWVNVLADWYASNWTATSTHPWSVNSGIGDCPDADAVYDYLTVSGYVVPDVTISGLIQANLQGIVDVAAAASPGVRVLNVGYPYPVNSSGNSCYADSGSTKGVHSVIDELNSDHTYVSGDNVKYVNLTSALGTSAVGDGYISTRRLYGWPHPSSSGESAIADAAVAVLTGSGW